MQTSNSYLLLLLLGLSVIRPAALSSGVVLPVGILCLGAALPLLALVIHKGIGGRVLWQTYKLEISLLVAYQALCIVSLLCNIERYDSVYQFFRWGTVFVIGQLLLPVCVLIFLLPKPHFAFPPIFKNISRGIPASIAVCVSLIPVLQTLLPDLTNSIRFYFVAWDLGSTFADRKQLFVNGVFATTTDLGAIAGVIAFTSIWAFSKGCAKSVSERASIALCACLAILAGLASNSANFILFVLTASFTLSVLLCFRYRRTTGLLGLTGMMALFLISPWILPSMLNYKIGHFLPYFSAVEIQAPLTPGHFIPQLTASSLGARAELWSSALTAIANHPFLGVSNGGFRLDYSLAPIDNSHNVFMQSAIDAGLLGLVIAISMILRIASLNFNNVWFLSLLCGVLATLCVDNFSDHSYAWCVVTAYCTTLMAGKPKNKASLENCSERVNH